MFKFIGKTIKYLIYLVVGLIVVGTILTAIPERKDISKVIDEKFKCSASGFTGNKVVGYFEIKSQSNSLLFSQSGELFGTLIKFPVSINYPLKTYKGDKIETSTHSHNWINQAGQSRVHNTRIETDNKDTFKFIVKQKYIEFRNCEKIN